MLEAFAAVMVFLGLRRLRRVWRETSARVDADVETLRDTPAPVDVDACR
jgi:hypothetical protein